MRPLLSNQRLTTLVEPLERASATVKIDRERLFGGERLWVTSTKLDIIHELVEILGRLGHQREN